MQHLRKFGYYVTNVKHKNEFINYHLKSYLHTSFICFDLQEDFNAAQIKLGSLKEDPGNATKLKIYALYKQATEGKCTKKRPGIMDFVGKAKYDAWSSLSDMSLDAAKKEYISIVDELTAKEPLATESSSKEVNTWETLEVNVANGICSIKLNRPQKKNAITLKMYEEWISALEKAAEDSSVVITTITGAGDFFCSGNDLSNFTNLPDGMTPQEMAANAREVLRRFVSAFIEFPKPLVGLVNGPAVGISVTTLGLYDYVLASDKATFHTPFSNLGQTPEGCSSYIFPRLMGASRANAMLMFNRKLSAEEALAAGLVSEVIPAANFNEYVERHILELAALPMQTLKYTKQLIRKLDKDILHQVNITECDRLQERWLSEDCMNAIMKFFAKKGAN